MKTIMGLLALAVAVASAVAIPEAIQNGQKLESVTGVLQVMGHGEASGDPRVLYYDLLVHGGGRVVRAGVWRVGQLAQAALPASSPTTRHDTHRWFLFAGACS